MVEVNNNSICTIVAKNYLAFARTLCNSFLEHHPEGKCYVLVIDEHEGFINSSDEKFEILSPNDLEIPNWPDFSFKYNVTELATALKPYLLEFLLEEQDLKKLLYLDPDILVLHPLDHLFGLLNENDMVITPHLDTDYPDDGHLPNDAHVMKSGIYNLGFIGIRKSANSEAFLKWWQQKLYDRCVIDHAAGYFVDQKFIDYAIPLFKGFYVETGVGYNVAYWNIHSRKVEQQTATWQCNGGPLYFYHFSGFKAGAPDQISGHQTRFKMDELPSLKALFNHYTNLLINNGYHQSSNWPYSFNSFNNGSKIRRRVRKLHRQFQSPCDFNPFDKSNVAIALKALPAFLRSRH